MSERIETGYAALQVGSGDVPVQVSGIAIGENDVTIGGSGKQTLWPPETLSEAAEGLEGQPIATSENHTADGAQPQTPSDAVIGEVTWSGYKPGVGVLYEGEIDDPDIARSVENGRLEVSPLVSRDIEPLESDEAEFVATEINRWRDLATVVNGAAPSNEITVGDNPMKAEALHAAVESLQEGISLTPPEAAQNHAQDVLDWRDDEDKDVSGMTDTGWNRAEQLASGEELSANDVQEIAAWFARHGSNEYEVSEDSEPWEDNGRVAIKGWGGPTMRDWIDGKRSKLTEMGELEAMDDAESMADIADVSEDTLVKWGSSGERDAYGMVVDVREEGDEPLDGEIDGDQTINPPAALIEVHTPGEDGWEATDTMVGHTLNSDTLTVIDELPNPESLAKHKMEGMADVPEEYVFDNPGSAMSKASDMGMSEIHTHGDGDNTVFMPGATHSALMEELDMGGDEGPEDESMAPSNPVSDNTGLTMDDITDDELEALEQRRELENPKLVEQDDYESLQDRVAEVRSVMEESLAERTELKESTVAALDFEALCSEFEDDEGSLQVEAMRQTPESGEPEPEETEALSEDADTDKAEALYADYQRFENDRLKEDIVDALGVDTWEAATEVLN